MTGKNRTGDSFPKVGGNVAFHVCAINHRKKSAPPSFLATSSRVFLVSSILHIMLILRFLAQTAPLPPPLPIMTRPLSISRLVKPAEISNNFEEGIKPSSSQKIAPLPIPEKVIKKDVPFQKSESLSSLKEETVSDLSEKSTQTEKRHISHYRGSGLLNRRVAEPES